LISKGRHWRARALASGTEYHHFAIDALLRPDAGEWNTWWNYFIDCYDENPILRRLLAENSDEYSLSEMLKPERRYQQYIGAANRRKP